MKNDARILIACEESGIVTEEFIKLGYNNVWSCDIEPTSGNYPNHHLQQDVIPLLKEKWDMIIAFPPCTYLTSAGTKHFSPKCSTQEKIKAREALREEAKDFFLLFANADCDKIAIGNPVGYMNTNWRKPDQIIHPYYFGEPYQKRTCLWLKGLPKLEYSDTIIEKPKPMYICEGEKCKGKAIGWCEGIKGTTGGQKGRAKARSKTFLGIAKAMATQWTKND